MTPDSAVTIEDYIKRTKELDHKILSSMEHGFQGRYFHTYEMAKRHGLKFIFGTEAYWVKDRFEKDNTNCHICLFAKSEKGRRDINRILSDANIDGYYFKPRIDLNLLSTVDPNEVFVTSACIAFWHYDDIEKIVDDLHSYFGKNFMLEVQAHHTEPQKKLNKRIIDISNKKGIDIIFGCDSHYIYPEQAKIRDYVLEAKGIRYEDEEGWFMDYPDGETAIKRLKDQGVLTEEQIYKAMKNTETFMTFDDYKDVRVFSTDIKLPSIYPELSQEERNEKYKQLLNERWKEMRVKIPREKHQKYIEEIRKEAQVVTNTNMSDYFLLDYEFVKKGVERGGMITPSGRGSGVSFYTNTLLGFSKVDRVSAPVKLYPERFMSESRILETKSLPDLDLNLGTPEIFAEAQREILGEDHAYPMIAYGTFKRKSAFKLYARAKNIKFDIANEIASQLEQYEKDLKHADEDEKDLIDVYDYVDKKYHEILRDSEVYMGIISDKKPHPCFVKDTLILTNEGYKKIQDVQVGNLVLTHNNQYKKVLHTMNKKSNDIYQLKITGNPIYVTGNHPFYVRTNMVDKWGSVIETSDPYWKPVESLDKNDLIGIAINQESIIPHHAQLPTHNEDFWWFVGRYIGDGYSLIKSGKDYMTFISCHNNEIDLIEKKIKNLFHYNICKDKKSISASTFYIYNKQLYEFLKQFGKYAYGKKINNTIIDLPINLLKNFLEGYLSADGHYRNGEYTFKTISEQLALGLQHCIHKVYKMPCTIRTVVPSLGSINGREFRRKKIYVCRFKIYEAKKDRNFYSDGHIWIRYTKKNKLNNVNTVVYNLEVEEDNSYTANNFIVHNCAWLVYDGNIKEEIGLIKLKSESTKKEVIACLMDGDAAEKFKFLKNDLLMVDVVKIIHLICHRAGISVPTETELLSVIKNNKKVWDIYANGFTVGVNQVEREATRQKVMKYKPKNISELTAFIAAIRPAFKSMYDIFESRNPFSYGIKSFDKLIQTEEMPNSFILYQEMTMATLVYAGFPADETYGIIKAISKKKPDVVRPLKERFIQGFSQKIIENENVNEREALKMSEQVWQIIEDSSGYGFNAAHAYSYALDSAYCAYLKSHYPLYFYEVMLQYFSEKKNKDKIAKLKQEMQSGFGIKEGNLKFRNDNRTFMADKKNNTINPDLPSVKFMNIQIAEELYQRKDNHYNTFIDLLVDLTENTSINTRQMQILIKLNYFSEFGGNNELLQIFNEFSSQYKKTYVEKTKQKRIGLLKEKEKEIKQALTQKQLPIHEQIEFDYEHLGYSNAIYPEMKGCFYVLNIDTKYSPKLTIYSLATSKESLIKMQKNKLYENEKQTIDVGDIIRIIKYEMRPKKKNIDGKWVDQEEKEPWLISFTKVKK